MGTAIVARELAGGDPVIRVVLGLDQGARTGWGIAPERGRVVRHGLATTPAQRIEVVRLAVEFAGGDPRSLFVMFERHDHIPLDRLTVRDRQTVRRGPRQAAPERPSDGAVVYGMGRSCGRWHGLLDASGVPESHRLEARPNDWRRRVHGVTCGDVKRAAIDWASRYLGEPIEDDDHAEGVCLTAYGAIDGLAAYDRTKQQARLESRAKREAEKQAELFK